MSDSSSCRDVLGIDPTEYPSDVDSDEQPLVFSLSGGYAFSPNVRHPVEVPRATYAVYYIHRPQQRRALPSVEDRAISLLKQAVERAPEDGSPAEALQEIERIWSSTAGVTGLAEATMRRILTSAEKPALAETPDWWSGALATLREEDTTAHATAVEQASLLVRAVLARLRSAASARLAPGPRGAVEVVWEGPAHLQWLVHPAVLPWPGANVRVYAREDRTATKLTAKSLFLAESVIAHAVKHLREADGPR
jgi:hypothetical protein